MLCGLLFIQHMCSYCGHLNLIPLHSMYCDNLGLVTKTNKLLSFWLAPTQATLHSQYNVLVTIHDILKDLPALPIISHVKGHQDAKLAYEDLPLEAQLNCNADVLAMLERLHFPSHYMDPSPSTSLCQSTTLTGRRDGHLQALCNHSASSRSWSYEIIHARPFLMVQFNHRVCPLGRLFSSFPRPPQIPSIYLQAVLLALANGQNYPPPLSPVQPQMPCLWTRVRVQ
jgi:hypothetical protein